MVVRSSCIGCSRVHRWAGRGQQTGRCMLCALAVSCILVWHGTALPCIATAETGIAHNCHGGEPGPPSCAGSRPWTSLFK